MPMSLTISQQMSFNPVEFNDNYSATSNNNYEVGTLAVDGWAVTFGTARRGLGGAAARCPPRTLLAVPNVTAHP